jgi:pimeloyl-ACP methyl ester carboxylesterase
LVVREAAALAPGRVAELVLIDAWLGPPGASLHSLAPSWFADGIRDAAEREGDGWRIPAPDPAVVGVEEPAGAEWLRAQLTDHPLRSFEDATAAAAGAEVRQRAVLADPGPVPFEEMAAALGIDAIRLQGGHDLMVTAPDALACALQDVHTTKEAP